MILEMVSAYAYDDTRDDKLNSRNRIGSTGCTGLTGSTGSTDTTGHTGSTGSTGSTGHTGFTGHTGLLMLSLDWHTYQNSNLEWICDIS